jgi:hypothetical protein
MSQDGQEAQMRPRVDRPDIPEGYGIAKGEKGLLAWAEVERQLEQAHNYWVCTTRLDGRPHAIPVWGLWYAGRFYFGSDPESRKGRNLAANPAIVVHLESGDDTVIVEGEASRIVDEELRERLIPAYAAKYDVEAPVDYVVSPRAILAWQERDYPNTATRFRFS